ncbi:MAG TPA: hypothetical protein VGV59_06425 [Pyrinomonadaceae bacterium]|nr:hypothetical protein [Pyrinomonadaceae bacterium]
MNIELVPVDDWPSLVRPSYTHENNWYSYKLNTIWLEGISDSASGYDIAAHELSHYLLHVFTPYGAFLDELNNMQQNQVLGHCIDVLNYFRDKVQYPVYAFAKDLLTSQGRAQTCVKDPEFLQAVIKKYVNPWAHSGRLENILEGNNTPNVRAALEGDFLSSLRAVESYCDSYLYDDDALFEQPVQDNPSLPPRRFPEPINTGTGGEQNYACTRIEWGDRQTYPVGAIHIIESLAQLSESFNEDTWYRLYRSATGHPYLMLWLLTNMKLASQLPDSREGFGRLLNTYRALCDLAMFVPLGIIYGRLRPKGAAWFDLHPGCRFMVALDAVPKVGWVENLEHDLDHFQKAICRETGWPEPEQFLKLGAQLKHPEFLAHRDACRLRLQHPSAHLDAGLKVIEDDGFVEKHLPLTYLSTHGELAVRGTGAQALSLIMGFFLPQLCRAIMLKPELNYQEMLPQHIQFEGLFANIKSTDDWLELIFKAIPSLRPSNFQKYTV